MVTTADPAAIQSQLAAATLTTLTDSATETGPLSTLAMSEAQLWARLQSASPDSLRPYYEVCTAHWIRKSGSSAQLWETMTDFWHNHFSVGARDDYVVAGMWPDYDRVIRTNALGNFRTMLGAVAKSASMLQFLNLRENIKSHPNENYARELMELHTLGIASYFGLTTPAGQVGNGYSDQDVIAASRVLTGWTIANGSFTFNSATHDTGTKQVLGLTLSNGGQSEGETLLNKLAYHPATALFIANKLYVKFVSDTIPANSPLITALVAKFLATTTASNQIAQLIGVIAQSNEFAQSTGLKFKTPNEITASWLRATGSSFSPQTALRLLGGVLDDMGATLYDWITPDGQPDVASAWISSNGLLARWNFPETLCAGSTGMAMTGGLLATYPADPVSGKPSLKGLTQFVNTVAATVVPTISAASLSALQQYAALPTVLGASATYNNPAKLRGAVGSLVAAALALPEFQIR